MSEKTGPCGFCGKSREEHWPGRMHTFVEPTIRLGAHDKECPYSEGNAPDGAVCHCAAFGGRRASPAEALIYERGGYAPSGFYAPANRGKSSVAGESLAVRIAKDLASQPTPADVLSVASRTLYALADRLRSAGCLESAAAVKQAAEAVDADREEQARDSCPKVGQD